MKTPPLSSSNAARFDGIIKSWNDERGFGFIEPARGGDEIFIHISAYERGGGRPQVGQRVSFEVELGPQGKKRARHVAAIKPAKLRPTARRDPRAQWGTASLFAVPAFLVLYLVVSLLWNPPHGFALVYVAASVLTFLAYALDKWSAARGSGRTPESTLHALALVGGWPGALVAQQLLRHKSVKSEFRAVFWGTVATNVAGFIVLSSPLGRLP